MHNKTLNYRISRPIIVALLTALLGLPAIGVGDAHGQDRPVGLRQSLGDTLQQNRSNHQPDNRPTKRRKPRLDKRRVFYGTWGTAKQCAREPIKPGGTIVATPFEISTNWLKQGQVWCRLSWFPVQPRSDGFFSGAQAQCGEDSIRDYLLRMNLRDGRLTLSWDLLLANGPLQRCDKS